ncbi:MAG: ParB/RepB/Spo0J family partition protein [Burkholderiales bacterium]
MKAKGLGRGLDALLDAEGEPAQGLRVVKVGLLQPGKYQPRTHMDQEALQALAESIKSQGVIQPVLVREGAGRYEIIAGERRWRAACMAGLKEIPVLVRNVPDADALKMSLIENIQREDLNPLEEAQGIKRLTDEFQLTHDAAAHTIGRSRSAVTNLLRLLNLAMPVQQMLIRGGLEMGHARALLALSAAKQIEIAAIVEAQQLSVRQTEQLVHRLQVPRGRKTTNVDRDILRLQDDLSDKLGTRVSLQHSKSGRGKLLIEYTSLEHLESLLSKL